MEGATVAMAVIAGLAGLAAGSYLDVVRHHLRGGTTIAPFPGCPHCSHQITGIDLIPVLGWMLLRGRCRHCDGPIPTRHPLQESAHGVTWAAIGATATALGVGRGWITALALIATSCVSLLLSLPPRSAPWRVLKTGFPLFALAAGSGGLVELIAGRPMSYAAWTASAVSLLLLGAVLARRDHHQAPPQHPAPRTGQAAPRQASTGLEFPATQARRGQGPEGGWQAMHAALQADLAVSTAMDYVRGYRCLRVIHADPEDQADMDASRHLQEALRDLPRLLGGHDEQLVRVIETTDTTTWWWASTELLRAQTVVDHARKVAAMHARPGWILSEDPL
jgi:hypothetical protein